MVEYVIEGCCELMWVEKKLLRCLKSGDANDISISLNVESLKELECTNKSRLSRG